MILISEKRESGSNLQQELRHILHQCFLDLSFQHIRLEWNEIKNVWVFHCLDGKLALRGWQPQFKIGHFLRQSLPLV